MPVKFQAVAALAALTSVFSLSAAAHAQWAVTNLRPIGTFDAFGYAAAGSQQAGTVNVTGSGLRASLWNGTAASWVDLHPAGQSSSVINATDGTQQAGSATSGGVQHAGHWSGTAASWVSLHPAGATASVANAVGGGMQGGIANVGGVSRASLWSGTAASWVDLNPVGSISSSVSAISGGRQVGTANIGGANRAGMWTGTAASWVDLHPAGASNSFGLAADGAFQAGYAITGGGVTRASLWNGTAASWVDLHPPVATSSTVYAAAAGMQVGIATVGGVQRASFWTGTSASWVDLAAFLPSGYANSSARGISIDAANVYVTGWAVNTTTNRTDAILWTRPMPTGACCNTRNGQCILLTAAQCSVLGHRFDGVGSACSPSTCRPCPADFNGTGGVSLQDIFDFLNAWFAGCP